MTAYSGMNEQAFQIIGNRTKIAVVIADQSLVLLDPVLIDWTVDLKCPRTLEYGEDYGMSFLQRGEQSVELMLKLSSRRVASAEEMEKISFEMRPKTIREMTNNAPIRRIRFED